MFSVVNVKHSECEVYIGRPSVLGNPYVIGKHGTREVVVEMYRQWLWRELNKNNGNNAIMEELKRISCMEGDVRLGCWCKPSLCHGDIIVKAIDWLNRR